MNERHSRPNLLDESAVRLRISLVELDLTVDGGLATGTWTERTSPTGHYRAATYHGLVQLVVDPTGRTMTGMWLGIGRRYVIKSGPWRLERMPEPPDR